jgi:hypothetical protein
MTMPRVQEPGSLHEAIAAAVTAAGRKPVAAALGVAGGTLSRYEDAGDNGLPISAQRLEQMCRMFPGEPAAVIARHFAAVAGGTFVSAHAPAISPSEACGTIATGAARLTAELFAALDPRGPGGVEITTCERARIVASVQALATAVTSMQVALIEVNR